MKHMAFPFIKKFGKFLSGISVWEERVLFVRSPIRSQAPLCRFTKRPVCKLFCYFREKTYFLVAFPTNKCLLLAHVVMKSLTSASSYLSWFTKGKVRCYSCRKFTCNEELQENFSELCIVNFYIYNLKKP